MYRKMHDTGAPSSAFEEMAPLNSRAIATFLLDPANVFSINLDPCWHVPLARSLRLKLTSQAGCGDGLPFDRVGDLFIDVMESFGSETK